jgi:hypothetical protein
MKININYNNFFSFKLFFLLIQNSLFSNKKFSFSKSYFPDWYIKLPNSTFILFSEKIKFLFYPISQSKDLIDPKINNKINYKLLYF